MSLSNAFALADGTFLALEAPYEAPGAKVAPPSKICAVIVDPGKGIETEKACIASHLASSAVGAIAQDTRFVALYGNDPDRIVAFDTATWKVVTDVPGHPIYTHVDSRGRVGWDHDPGVIDIASGTRIDAIKVTGKNAFPASLVGFIGERVLVGHPVVKKFESEAPLHTLADFGACGYLTTQDVP